MRPLAFFALQAGLWTALSFAFAALLVLAGPFEWTAALGISAVNWLPWVVLTPVIFWLSGRFPLERGRLLASVPAHLFAGLACTAICLWISATAFPLTRPGGGPQGFREFRRGGPDGFSRSGVSGETRPPLSDAERAKRREEFLSRQRKGGPSQTPPTDRPAGEPGGEFRRDETDRRSDRTGPDARFLRGPGGPGAQFPGGGPDRAGSSSFVNELRRDFFGAFGPFALRGNFGLAIYLIVVSAAHALGFYRRAKERDLQAVELTAGLNRAKLDALRLQLQPHFLFNTLNAISTLVHRDARAADELISDLSDLLRLSLHTTDNEVPLARELDLLDRYLAIEQARLGSRLRIVREIDPAATAALVPTFVLQPLAENAVRHGLEPRAGAGTLTISARTTAQSLILSVADDGVGLATDQATARRGIGLANTEARLQALHGTAAKLEMITPPGGGLRVELTLPFKVASHPDKPTSS